MSSTIDINKICEWCGKELSLTNALHASAQSYVANIPTRLYAGKPMLSRRTMRLPRAKNKDVFQQVTTFHHDNVPFYWGLASLPCTAVLQRV